MKNKFLIILVVLAVFLSSCALSLRSDETTAADGSIPEETYAETSAETSAQASVGTVGEVSTEVPTEALSSEDTSESPSETEAGTDSDAPSEEPVTEAPATEEPTEAPTQAPQQTTDSVELTPPNEGYTPKVMMYHLILDEVYSVYEALFVSPVHFEEHLQLLNELGYEYLFAEEWRLTSRPSVVLTLDDGYLDNYTNMFPLLKKYGAKATVFIVTDLIDTEGYMTRDMIKEMSASGLVSFQCHTAHHLDLSYLSADELRADFNESVSIIESLTGKQVSALAYPGGSYNDTVLSVVPEYFSFAYTTKSPTSTPSYGAHNIPRYYVARGYGRAQFMNFLAH